MSIYGLKKEKNMKFILQYKEILYSKNGLVWKTVGEINPNFFKSIKLFEGYLTPAEKDELMLELEKAPIRVYDADLKLEISNPNFRIIYSNQDKKG